MKKYFGSLLVAASMMFIGLGFVSLSGCSSNTGDIPGAPGPEEPEEELSEEEEAAEEEIGSEDGEEE